MLAASNWIFNSLQVLICKKLLNAYNLEYICYINVTNQFNQVKCNSTCSAAIEVKRTDLTTTTNERKMTMNSWKTRYILRIVTWNVKFLKTKEQQTTKELTEIKIRHMCTSRVKEKGKGSNYAGQLLDDVQRCGD